MEKMARPYPVDRPQTNPPAVGSDLPVCGRYGALFPVGSDFPASSKVVGELAEGLGGPP